jgi:preprotein translocase subunit SecB
MKINIEGSCVTELFLVSDKEKKDAALELFNYSDDNAITNGNARFKTRVEFGDDTFFVIFALTLKTEEDVVINICFRSQFRTDAPLDEEFRKGSFPFVNAPAIAYPYLRAYVSNFTLNSGYAPIMLPSVNFVAMKQKVIADSMNL